MTNNDILKKLRVALKLRDDEIVEILKLVDFDITKGALGDLFRKEDHETTQLASCPLRMSPRAVCGLLFHSLSNLQGRPPYLHLYVW